MDVPLIIKATHFAPLAPMLVVGAAWGRNFPAPFGRLLLVCLALMASSAAEVVLAAQGRNNLWLSWYAMPVDVSLMLWTLEYWQTRPVARRIYRLAIPAVILFTAVMVLATDPTRTFDVWTWPLLALAGLSAAVHTLVVRSLGSRSPLGVQDWFWVCLGLIVFWISSVPLPAFAQAVINTRESWVISVYVVRAWVLIGAFVLITWGVRQPRTTLFSGPS